MVFNIDVGRIRSIMKFSSALEYLKKTIYDYCSLVSSSVTINLILQFG